MATGFMKRNKTMISKIKRNLENSLKIFFNEGNCKRQIDMIHTMVPKEGIQSDVEVPSWFFVYFDKPEVILKEFDSRLVFGMDLSRPKFEYYFTYLPKHIARACNDYPSSDFAKSVFADLGDPTGESLSTDYIVGKAGSTMMYSRIVNYFEKNQFLKYEVKLKDGQYPFVKDRKILPIFVVDEDSGKGFYINGKRGYNQVHSYREGHVTMTLNSFEKEDARKACSGIPLGLLELSDDSNAMALSKW